MLWCVLALACAAPAAGGCQFRWGWGLLVVASALLLAWHAFRTIHRTVFWAPFSWVFAALVGLHALQLVPLPASVWTWLAPVKASFLPGEVASGSWQSLSANVEATRDNLLVLLACGVAYQVGWAVFHRRTYVTYLGLAFLALGFALSVYGLSIAGTQSTTKFLGVPVHSYGNRVSGTYTGSNQFAGLLTLVIPLAGVALLARVASGERSRHHLLSRVIECLKTPSRAGLLVGFGVAWLVMLAALMLTQSRMGIASCLLGAVLSYALIYRLHLRFPVFLGLCLAIAVLVLAGAALGLDPVLGRYSLLFESRAVEAEGLGAVELRPHIWADSVGLAEDHWLLGGGSGAFRSLYPHYQSSKIVGWAKFAHNDYLNAWTDLGLVGLAVILIGLFLWFRAMLRNVSRQDHVRMAMAMAIVWSVCAILLHSLTLFNLQEPANAWLFCLLMGVGLGLRAGTEPERVSRRSAESAPGPSVWMRVGMIAVTVCAMLLGAGSVLWAESLWPADRTAFWRSRARGNLKDARNEIQAARAVDPLLRKAYVAEARAVIDAAGEPEAPPDPASMDEAEQLLRCALLLSPLDVEARYELVRHALARNDFLTAQTEMAEAKRAAPCWPALALARGRIELQIWKTQGEPGDRVPDHVLESLATATADGRITTLGRALGLLFSAAEWEPRWERVVPANAPAWQVYARALASQERLKAAAEAGAEALRLLDADVALDSLQKERLQQGMDVELGLVLVAIGRYEEARSRFVSCLARATKNQRTELASSIWRRARDQGQPNGGMGLAEGLARAFPDEAWGADLIGFSFVALGQWAEAADAFRRAVELEETGERCGQLASALFELGQLDSALARLDRAILLGPDRPDYHLRLADWLSRKGYTSRAIQEVQFVRQRWPERSAECKRMDDVIGQRRTGRPVP